MKVLLIILGIILAIFILFLICSCIVAGRVDRLEDDFYER